MSPVSLPRPAALALLALVLVTPPASADSLVAAAPDARNLTAGGGWYAWAAPAPGGQWRLTVRNPATGLVSVPDIPAFGAAPDPMIGSAMTGTNYGSRRLVATYARCAGASTVKGCDIWQYDIVAGTEAKVPGLSSSRYSETAPSVYLGTRAFVRHDGAKPGVYVSTARGGVRRISKTVARETSVTGSGSRVAYAYRTKAGGGVALRRVGGEGGAVTLTSKREEVPHSLVTTRYRAAWLEGTTAWQTTRFGSGEPDDIELMAQKRALPASVDSIATDGSQVVRYLDARGVTAIAPPLF